MTRVETNSLVDSRHGGRLARYFHPRKTRLWLPIVTVLGLLVVPAAAHASSVITQGFLTNDKVPPGSIVSLQKDSATYVNATTTTNANNILGVVINGDNSQVALMSDSSNQVQVATGGLEEVLVSDINGNIDVGDPITASPVSGVGMKATDNVTVVGIAQDTFPNKTSSKQTYTDKDKISHTANIGEIPVLVNVAYYYKQPNKTLIPTALQNIANNLAGKPVSPLPILISIAIFIVTLIIVVSIIYSMIHSSIISVGRNPMSQAAVYRNVIQLSGLVIVILGVAVFAIYMVLRNF